MGLLETLDTDSGSLNHGWIARDLVRDAHTAAAPHMTKELLVCSLAASEPCVEGRKSFSWVTVGPGGNNGQVGARTREMSAAQTGARLGRALPPPMVE